MSEDAFPVFKRNTELVGGISMESNKLSLIAETNDNESRFAESRFADLTKRHGQIESQDPLFIKQKFEQWESSNPEMALAEEEEPLNENEDNEGVDKHYGPMHDEGIENIAENPSFHNEEPEIKNESVINKSNASIIQSAKSIKSQEARQLINSGNGSQSQIKNG